MLGLASRCGLIATIAAGAGRSPLSCRSAVACHAGLAVHTSVLIMCAGSDMEVCVRKTVTHVVKNYIVDLLKRQR